MTKKITIKLDEVRIGFCLINFQLVCQLGITLDYSKTENRKRKKKTEKFQKRKRKIFPGIISKQAYIDILVCQSFNS